MDAERPDAMELIREQLSMAEKPLAAAREMAFSSGLEGQGEWLHMLWSLVMLGGFEVASNPSLSQLVCAARSAYMEYLSRPATYPELRRQPS